MPFKCIHTFQYIKFIIYKNSDGPILKDLNCHTWELDYNPMSNEESLKVSE